MTWQSWSIITILTDKTYSKRFIRSSEFIVFEKNAASFFITPSTNASGQEAPLVIKIFTGVLFGK
jgi:hypothetical protein